MRPMGQLIGKQAWEAAIPIILDNDLQDVAFAVGAIDEKSDIEMPSAAAALLRLTSAREIDGVAVQQYLNAPAPMLKRDI